MHAHEQHAASVLGTQRHTVPCPASAWARRCGAHASRLRGSRCVRCELTWGRSSHTTTASMMPATTHNAGSSWALSCKCSTGLSTNKASAAPSGSVRPCDHGTAVGPSGSQMQRYRAHKARTRACTVTTLVGDGPERHALRHYTQQVRTDANASPMANAPLLVAAMTGTAIARPMCTHVAGTGLKTRMSLAQRRGLACYLQGCCAARCWRP